MGKCFVIFHEKKLRFYASTDSEGAYTFVF
jgi:hypothetical protein